MGRRPCCIKDGVNKGAWTAEEDKILVDYVKARGEGKWRRIPKEAGLKRCGKSCRLRWLNYLRPDIIRGNITSDEEDLIIRLHRLLGNRWSLIAGRLPGRTDNEIKNYWNTNLSKRVHGKKSKPDPKPESYSPDQLSAVHAGGAATPLHSPSPSAAVASESSGSFFSGCSFLLCDQTGSDPFDSGLSEHYSASAGRTSPEFGSDFDACVGPVVLSPEDAEEMNNNKWMDCEWGPLDVFLEAEDWINYP